MNATSTINSAGASLGGGAGASSDQARPLGSYRYLADRVCSACGVRGGLYQQHFKGRFRGMCRECHNACYRARPRNRYPENIEALAKQGPRQPWTQAHIDALKQAMAVYVSWHQIQRYLYRKAGCTRSLHSIQKKAWAMGALSLSLGWYRIREVQDACDLSRYDVINLIEDGRLPVAKRDRRGALMAAAAVEALIDLLPARRTTQQAAADLLGYSRETIRIMLNAGRIKGIRIGSKWLVDADSVQALAAELKATGRLVVLDIDHPYMADYRRRNSASKRRQAARQRQEATA